MKAKRFRGSAAVLLLLMLAVAPAWAQRARLPREPALDADLFPPNLVMRHQQEIDLAPEQSRAILEAAQQAQSQMLEAQWELGPALQAMRGELAQSRVDEDSVLTHLRAITEKEARVKEIQLRLMVRVKNLLTVEQQNRLRPIREQERESGRDDRFGPANRGGDN